MPRHSAPPCSATITLGLESAKTGFLLDKEIVLERLRALQDDVMFEKGYQISVAVNECMLQLSHHRVPHVRLEFINDPRTPIASIEWKQIIETMAGHLMRAAGQLLVIIAFADEMVILEQD